MDNNYQWPPQNEGKPPKKKTVNARKLGNRLLIGFLIIVLLSGAMSCFYTVNDKQQAVVTTFGRVTDVVDAGVHFKIPFGIQQVHKVDVNVYQKIELGYTTTGNDYYGIPVDNESSMITGDYNIVNVDFFVEYKISNPEAYLFFLRPAGADSEESDPEPGPQRGRFLHCRLRPDRRQGKHPDAGQDPGHRDPLQV